MEYVKAAVAADLSVDNKKKVTVNGREILLTKVGDEYYAVDDRCPHLGGSLYEGILEGSNIVCPKHKSVFDVKTGKVVQKGRLLFIRVKVKDIRSYPVKREGDDIYVGIE